MRDMKLAQRRKRLTLAKFKYLKEQPKKPEGALATFMKNKFNEARRKHPEKKGFELKNVLTEM